MGMSYICPFGLKWRKQDSSGDCERWGCLSADEVEQINRRLREDAPPASGNLGLYNLAKRLHLLYGKAEVGIQCTSGQVIVNICVDRKVKEEQL